jgi:phosphatidylinositol glycan class B
MVQKVLKYKIWNEIPLFYLLPLFICSYFSVGFHHFDEHFQILEYANYKMGYSSASDLPWEFGEKIRPTLQPWITVLFWKISNLFFEFNPFQFAFFLRFLTAVLSVVALVGIRHTFIHTVAPQNVNWYYRFSFLLWFMPFVMVRYSSETWSALFFVFGLIVTFSKPKIWKYFLAGLFFASSFWFRFQIAFMIFGLGLWLIFIKKEDFKYLVCMFFGFMTLSLLFIYLDTIFYNQLVFTPFNYFKETILISSKNFGSYGAWYYPLMFSLHLVPPISIIILFFILKYFYQNPKSSLTWISISFVLPHFIISHKEIRFLFPLFVFLPLILSSFQNNFSFLIQKFKITYQIIIILNCVLLVFIMFKPADIRIFNFKQLSDNGRFNNYVYLKSDLKTKIFPGLVMNYYKTFSIDSTKANYIIDNSSKIKVNTPFLIDNNYYKGFFLTKMGDDFEEYTIKKNKAKD